MINKNEKAKLRSIINMCNAVKTKDDFWLLKIKESCEELLK